MTYAQSLAELVRTAGAHDVSLALETPAQAQREIVAAIFGEGLADEISNVGYPGGIEVPLPAEDLYLYALDELEQRQAGYRTDGRTGQASAGWDESRYVIADWAANPVSVGRDGGLAYSTHGRGTWAYHPIAADLGTFLVALARWIEYFRGERSGEVLDADFELQPGIADEVQQRVGAGLHETHARNLAHFLLGTV